MKSDHGIKIKILDGIDTDFIVGIQIKELGSIEQAPKSNLCYLIIGNSIIQRLSIFSKTEKDSQNPPPALYTGTALKLEEPRRGSFFQVIFS
jgi:hypothetical protein